MFLWNFSEAAQDSRLQYSIVFIQIQIGTEILRIDALKRYTSCIFPVGLIKDYFNASYQNMIQIEMSVRLSP